MGAKRGAYPEMSGRYSILLLLSENNIEGMYVRVLPIS